MASGVDVDKITDRIYQKGFSVTLDDESTQNIVECGFRGANVNLSIVATNILVREQPVTLRGLMYRVVSAGWLPDTSRSSYTKLSRIMVRLRESGLVPFDWLVDGIRSTIKPSSWSGIGHFADTVRDAYRMDFWASLPHYVHIIAEKDAIAGVLAPVTQEYDVRLSPIRGYSSLSFAHEIASTWKRINKPIFCYYLGDFDASGFDLQRDIVEKLQRYSGKPNWIFENNVRDAGADTVVFNRLGVLAEDFGAFGLLPLAIKHSDTRAKGFREQHGDRCAELDALPSTELRRRLRDAIEAHIPQGEWERLKRVEELERETFNQTLAKLPKSA